MAPGYLTDSFVKRCSIPRRQARSSQLLDILLLKTTTGQRSLYFQGVMLWNALSDRLKICKDVKTFKLAQRKKLLEEFFTN